MQSRDAVAGLDGLGGPACPRAPEPDGTQKRLLLVASHAEQFCSIFTRYFSAAGYSVECVVEPGPLLAAIRARGAGLLVLDATLTDRGLCGPVEGDPPGPWRAAAAAARAEGIAVGASWRDMELTCEALASIPVERPKATKRKPHGLCLDKGYEDDEVRDIAEESEFAAHIRTRGGEAKAVKRKAGRRARRRKPRS